MSQRMISQRLRFVVMILFLATTLSACNIRPMRPKMGGLPPGETAPEIKAEGWFNGTPPSADELKDKVLVVDAWAFWCGPCRREAPHLVAAYEKYKDKGVIFLGLTAEGDDKLEHSEAFLKETGITWPNGYGAGETLYHFETTGVPSIWVIGRDGKIVWNRDSDEELEAGIEQALAAKE